MKSFIQRVVNRAKLLKFLKWLVIGYLSLATIVYAFSPWFIRYLINDALAPKELLLTDESTIRYNPFLAHVSIRDLVLVKQSALDTPVLSVASLDLQGRLYQVLLDEIYVSEFVVDGLKLSIIFDEENLEVAGVTLLEKSEEPEAIDQPQASKPLLYKLVMPKMVLKNSTFSAQVFEGQHQWHVNNLAVNELGADINDQSLSLALNSHINGAPLAVEAEVTGSQGDAQLNVTVDLDRLPLERFGHLVRSSVDELEGYVSYQGRHSVQLNNNHWSMALSDLEFQVDDALISSQGYSAQLVNHGFTANRLVITEPAKGRFDVVGEGHSAIKGFQLHNSTSLDLIASINDLLVSGIQWQVNPEQVLVELEAVTASDIIASKIATSKKTASQKTTSQTTILQTTDQSIPPLAEIFSVNVSDVTLTQQSLAIGGVEVSGLKVDAQLDAEKNLMNLVAFAESTEPADALNKEETASESVFDFALAEFKFVDDGHIHFTDNSVQPIYERNIILTEVNTGQLDSQKPGQQSPYVLEGTSEEYASFAFEGVTQPFLEKPIYSVKGGFKEISLPGISPYIKDALKYEVQLGQLDLGLDVTLEGEEIDGDADVVLRRIELTAADDHEAGTIKDHTSVPFNMALGMLKDGDGNIELGLPLAGNINSPSFGVSGFMTLLVKKAALSAAKDYLMTTFVPYASVVDIAISAGQFALKVRFNDLEFNPAETTLPADQQEFLDQFATLMRDKEDVQVSLCPVATAEDIGKPAGSDVSSPEDIESLKAISEQRSETFKRYMVERAVDSSRLLMCTPQVDTAGDAKPKLVFST